MLLDLIFGSISCGYVYFWSHIDQYWKGFNDVQPSG